MEIIAILVSLVNISIADEWNPDPGFEINPKCLVKGPVYLLENGEILIGFIGETEIVLKKEDIYFYGKINKLNTKLKQVSDSEIKGFIGGYPVSWTIDTQTEVIYGYQNCPRH
jgi:hypothetical protein